VFASLVKQHAAGETANKADWLIGTELLGPEVKGHALFSLIEPGTAYDDPTFGKNPQVAHMKDYVKTAADNGGVHINCGIPNRAFVLAAKSLKGRAWERAGKVWYVALTGASRHGRLGPKTRFAQFAQATIAAATDLYPNSSVDERIREAWIAVGVEPQARGRNARTSRTNRTSASRDRSSRPRKVLERTTK
jgi:Zn-dependent metalloprotease